LTPVKEKIGYVVSTRMQKTIIVEVEKRILHPLYKKTIRRKRKFYAHDEKERAKVGDRVKIRECRPLSRTKRWYLLEIL
jgi:small subunit ribosomal protein S17